MGIYGIIYALDKEKGDGLQSFDIIVVGAGASGMMAAITAARENKKVLVLEHLDKIGKKLLSTGNGKCNYTNRKQGSFYYRGNNPAFVVPVFEQFSFDDTIRFFKELGIYPKEKNGYFYPYSEQAVAMVEVLQHEMKRVNICVMTETNLKSIKKKNGYVVRTTNGDFCSRKLIFATGLLAGRKTGCDGSAFQYIEELGHHFIDIVPALVQMKSKESFLKELAGIRAEICLKMYVNDSCVFEDKGELLHIDGGLSGIVSFQASRYASYGCLENKSVHIEIDYFPIGTEIQLYEELKNRFRTYGSMKRCMEALVGLFPFKLGIAFLNKAEIPLKSQACKVSDEQLSKLTEVIKHCRLEIDGTKDYADAQVCAGGVDTKEVDAQTLESKFQQGLYFCGELLDIDGMCGGYNLQWAWSSGYVAGSHAAK